MLLEQRGVPYESFAALQERHLAKLSECLTDGRKAIQLLESIGAAGGGDEDESDEVVSSTSHGALGAALGMLRHGVPMTEPFLHGDHAEA